MEFADGGFGFGGHLDETDEVGGGEDAGVVCADAVAVVGDGDIAQDVEVAAAAADDVNVGLVEEVDFACEGAFRSAGPFGDGFEEAGGGSTPADDEARFGELDGAEDGAVGFFQCGEASARGREFGGCGAGWESAQRGLQSRERVLFYAPCPNPTSRRRPTSKLLTPLL